MAKIISHMAEPLLMRLVGGPASTPGPGAYNTSRGIGADSLKFTLKGRTSIDEDKIDAPYYFLPSSIGEGPKFTLSGRHEAAEDERTPGPSYVTPAFGQEGRKTTVGIRTIKENSKELIPGPGAYQIPDSLFRSAKAFTLKSRHELPSEITDTPGPAAYIPNYEAARKRAPASSLHIRPRLLSAMVTPGPSDYEIDRSLGGSLPTFHIRPSIKTTFATPGPGEYTPENPAKATSLKFTIKGRHNVEEAPLSAPYRSLPSSIGSGPKISLSSRHEIKAPDNIPGPSYIPQPLGAGGLKFSMASRHEEMKDTRSINPGPGTYDVPSSFGKGGNAFTLKSRTKSLIDVGSISPGPGAYYTDYRATKPRAPASSLHIRPQSVEERNTVGYYDLGSTLSSGPKFTIGLRESLPVVLV